MQIKTRGIVLHKTKYSENSVIVNIFTREAGVQSFIVKGAYSKQRRGTIALLENLSMVEVVSLHDALPICIFAKSPSAIPIS